MAYWYERVVKEAEVQSLILGGYLHSFLFSLI